MQLVHKATKAGDLADPIAHILNEFDVSDFRRVEHLLKLLSRQKPTLSGFPSVRPHHFTQVIVAANQLFAAHKAYFRTKDDETVTRFFKILDELAETDIKHYPNELTKLKLLEAEARLLIQDGLHVREIIGPYAEKIYLVEDGEWDLIRRVFELDGRARLISSDIHELSQTYLARTKLLVHVRPFRAWAVFREFSRFLCVGKPAKGHRLLGRAACRFAKYDISLRVVRGTFVGKLFVSPIRIACTIAGGLLLFAAALAPELPLFGPTRNAHKKDQLSPALWGASAI